MFIIGAVTIPGECAWQIAWGSINQCWTQGENGWADSLACQTKRSKSSNEADLELELHVRSPQDFERSRAPHNKGREMGMDAWRLWDGIGHALTALMAYVHRAFTLCPRH